MPAFSKAAYEKKRRAEGLCLDCPRASTTRLCSVCLEKRKISAKNSVHRRVQQGLCRQCGSPNESGGQRCNICLEINREEYHSRVRNGQCVYCRDRATAGAFCFRHWLKNIGSPYSLRLKNGGLAMLQQLWEEQRGLCAVTGKLLIPGNNASLDHIIPVSKGGLSTKDNLRWVLYEVNFAKADLTHEQFVEMCRDVVRFHERTAGRSTQTEAHDQRSN